MKLLLALITALVVAAVVATGTAQAQSCGDVPGVATEIRPHNVSCAEAQRLLRQWGANLPKDQFGWFCADHTKGRTICAGGNGGGAPYFTFRPTGLPPGVQVIDPPGPPGPNDILRPWLRFGMTEAQWRSLEQSVVDQICHDWRAWVFGCPIAGLTIDAQGRVKPIEVVQSGVGSALARVIGRTVARAMPRALAAGVARLPLGIKARLAAAGAIRSPGAQLPVWRKGQPTRGVLDAGGRELPVSSGVKGWAQQIPKGTRGFDAYFRRHAEGHAVAYMRIHKIREAIIYINRAEPCAGTCQRLLRRALPKGYVLYVVSSTGRVTRWPGGL